MHILVAGGKATITLLDDALIRLTYAPDTEVAEVDAQDVLEKSLNLVDGSPYAILVDMSPILSMSLGARALFCSEAKVLAAAMLGDTPMDRVIAASITQSVHEVRFFTDEDAALGWLRSCLREAMDPYPQDSEQVLPLHESQPGLSRRTTPGQSRHIQQSSPSKRRGTP